jgi:hypothetical protein
MNKGPLLSLVCACLLGAQMTAATASAEDFGVRDDLWDVHKGAVLTAHTDLLSSPTDPGMFGGDDFASSSITTQFADGKTNGYVHFVEWRVPGLVSVNHIRLFAAGDGALYNNGREFGRFTLKVKSPGSAVFDTTVVNFIPTHPYTQLGEKFLVLDQTFDAVTRQEFRAEFEQIDLRAGGYNAPRVIELDAFGPPVPPVITQQPISTSVFAGVNAGFSVAATGTDPVTFTWKHAGTNVVLGDHFQAADGRTLLINNTRVEDAGAYTVLVANSAGNVESDPAVLTVNLDTNAPIVSITAPASGIVNSPSFNLQGNVSDDVGVVSARLEKNGVPGGDLTISDGQFSVPVTIATGETHLKVIAKDAAGNEGSAEVVVSLSPTAISSDDLWDVSRGNVVTASSGVHAEQGPGLFGGEGFYAEPGSTLFADDKPEGFAHFIEWQTIGPVTISTVRLYAAGDGAIYNNEREFDSFTLKTKSPASTNFDVTVFTFVPQHPYNVLDPATSLILETNVPVFTAQEFRGEFVQFNGHRGYDGPRIVELDAFGPTAGGAPEIVNQPASREDFVGGRAEFLVGATGGGPLSYQWRHEGTNLADSDRISGAHSWKLTINELTAEDAGKYSVVISNSQGEATSGDATLTVNVDSTAPVVTITSPASGAQTNGTFTLGGTVGEANVLASVRWEFNGRPAGDLPLVDGHFSVPGQVFQFGENHIKVIARDVSGNEGVAEVTATWTAPRALVLEHPANVQEGSRVEVPISLVSTGGVAGATFVVSFDTNYLSDAQFNWASSIENGFTSANLQSPRQLRASFALPGTTLSQGSAQIAMLSFRARSVPTNITTQLRLELVGIYSDSGDQYTNNNFLQPTTALITKRKVTGDVNANDRLDVGDASLILRLVSLLDPVRFWDRSSNDLNKNGDVDSGDVIKVLRAVVGLDPQPVAMASTIGKKSQSQTDATASVIIVTVPPPPRIFIPPLLAVDKATAVAGDKVAVEVRISAQSQPVSGASFRLEYPMDALRLDDASANQVGPIVPGGAVALWNLSPNQNNYATQDGAISLAVSSATTWPTNNGVLARFTFTVQAGAASRYEWLIALKGLEVSHDGFATEILGDARFSFIGHAPDPTTLSANVSFTADGKPKLSFQGNAGAWYEIHSSEDLWTWRLVGTQYSADGLVEFTDPQPSSSAAHFYRAVLTTSP